MGKLKNKAKNFKGGIISRLYHDLRWIYSFFSNYTGRIGLYVFIELIHIIVEFMITYKVGSLVDYIVLNDYHKMIYIGLAYVGMIIINATISIAANRCAAWNYNSMQADLVKKMYKKILCSDWEDLTKFHTGDLLTRLSNDAKVIAQNTTVFLTTILTNSIMMLASVIVILHNDASMILVVLIVAPVIVFSSRIYMKKIYEAQAAIKVIESKENAYNKESFHNIQAVKAFGLADKFYEKIRDLEAERYTADMKSNFYSLMSWGITYIGGIFAGIICISWAFYRVSAGVMTLGALTIVVTMALRIAIAGKTILGQIPVSLQLAVSTERVCEIVDLKDEEVHDSAEYRRLVEIGAEKGIAVHIKDMSFAYKTNKQIFNKISMEAHPGEIIALVGPSGEGKTTLLRILLGILNIQEGEAFACIEGLENEKSQLSTETRSLIAYVPQGNTMLSGTIEENMRLIAPDATEEEIIDALKQSCAYDFVKKLPDGIHHNIGESGIGFSEGQNQRLAIARAIIRKTPILLMDEATSALDVATERQVLNNIMKKDGKRTCILTTHRPSVLSACDRVYRISDGNVTVIGDAEIQKLMNEF